MFRRSHSYFLYLASGIAGRAAMLAVLIVMTRFLGAAEYGLFALVVTTGEIMDMIASNWIRIRFLRDEAGRRRIGAVRLGRMLILLAAMTFTACLAAIAISFVVSAPRAAPFALSTAAYITAFAMLRLCLTLMQQQRNHYGFASVELTRAILAPALAIGAAAATQSYFAASLAWSLATGLCATAGVAYLLRTQVRPRLARRGYARALAFGAPVSAVIVLSYSLGWYDRFILDQISGPAAVGVYAAAFALARQPVSLFLNAMNTYTFPRLAETYASSGSPGTAMAQSGLMVSMTGLGVPIAGGLIALSEPLAELILPPELALQAGQIIPVIAAGTLLINLKLFVFDNSFYVTQKTGLLIGYMIPVALTGLGASISLIWLYGLHGAAAAYLLSGTIALIASIAVSRKALPFPILGKRIAGIIAAAVTASAAAYMVSSYASAAGPLVSLVSGGTALVAVYLIALAAMRFPLLGALTEPWTVYGKPVETSGGPAS